MLWWNSTIKSNLGKKEFILTCSLLIHRPEKSGQEHKVGTDAKTMRSPSYWLLPCGLLSLLSYSSQDHSELSILTSTINKKMKHSMAHRPVWWGHLPNWSSLFLNDASLCQIDIPMTITVFLTVCAEYYLTTESCVVLKYKWTFQHDSKWNKPYTVVQYALGFHSYERCRQSKSAQKGGTVESKVWGTFRTLTANEWDIAFRGLGGF